MRYDVRIFLLVILVLNILGCNRKPYAETNKSYQKQAKAFAETLTATPEEWNSDSIKQPAYWVGTTNFNLRKPSFVIIHHTAQNACEQTLKTFTMVKTQVSAHYVICRWNRASYVKRLLTCLAWRYCKMGK